MSILTPIKQAVKIFSSTDKEAPQLNRQANELQVILKACLVTGYGDKQSAGWDLSFEEDGIKVFSPKPNAHTHFFLKLSNDTGQECKTQVYTDMTAIDNGQLRLELATPFKYGIGNATTHKWALVATTDAFWFFHETGGRIDVSATYLYCGKVGQNTKGSYGVLLSHTGGVWDIYDTDRYAITSDNAGSTGGFATPKLLVDDTVVDCYYLSMFDSIKNHTTNVLVSPIFVKTQDELFGLPAYNPSVINKAMWDKVENRFMVATTSTHYQQKSNIYIPVDYWEF